MRRVRRSTKAFTLLEVLLAVAIMAVVAGGIYSAMSAAFGAVDYLYAEQERQATNAALVELLRRNFACLSSKAVLSLEVREERGKYLSEVTVKKAPAAFPSGEQTSYHGLTILGLEPQSNGRLGFGLRRMSELEGNRTQEGVQWMLLAGEFREFRWEFYDAQHREWVGKWIDEARTPSLVRLHFQRQGEIKPTDVTFILPWTGGNPDAQRQKLL